MTEKKEKLYIHSIGKFNEWIRAHHKHGMIYRGLKDSRRDLDASLYRRLEKSELPKDIPGFVDATKKLIEKARKEGHRKGMNDLELLAELQHNGAATCLIDFTYNSLVALWFACQSGTKEQLDEEDYIGGKIVALDTKHTEKVSPTDWKEGIEFFLDEEPKKLWEWSPPRQNHRIVVQQSVFILGKEIIENEEIDEFCFVCEKDKENILKELKQYGISEDFLFCDFSGFVQQNKWDKPYQDLTSDDYFRIAKRAGKSGNLEKAIECCNKSIDIDSQNLDAYFLRGRIKGKNGDDQEAIADLNEVTRINPQHDDAYYRLGVIKLKLGDYEAAIMDCSTAIDNNPQHAKAYRCRSLLYQILENYEEAKKDSDTATNLDPRNPLSSYMMMIYLLIKHRTPQYPYVQEKER